MNDQSRLSIVIEAINNAGSTLKSITGQFGDVAKGAASASSGVQGTGNALSSTNPKLADLMTRAREATIAYNQMRNSGTASAQAIEQQRMAAVNLTRQLSAMKDSQDKVSGSTKSMAGAVILGNLATKAITATFAALKSAGSQAVDSTSNLEQANVAFTTMTGSAGVASQTLERLSQLSMNQAMSFPDAITGAKRIMAYGISAQEVIPIMSALGDITAGVGKDKMPFLTLALGQVRSKTKLYGQELRQFTEAGIPLLEQLAKQSGKSTSQIQKDMENGVGPSYTQVRDALVSMTQEGGKFYGLAEKQANTFSGTVIRIKNEAGIMFRSIMGITEGGNIIKGGPFDKLKDAATSFFNFLSQHKDTIANTFRAALTVAITVIRSFRTAIDFLGPSFISAAIAAVVVTGAMYGVYKAFVAVRAIMLAVTFTPLGIFLTALAVLAGVVVAGALKKMTNSAKSTTDGSKDLADTLKNGLPEGANASAASVNKLGDQLAKIDEQIKTANRDFIESMAEMVKSHQGKVTEFKSQISDEDNAFTASQAKRLDDWNKTQADMLLSHQQKTDSINRQIAYEVAKGSQADAQKLASLQSELEQENLSYGQSVSEKQQQYQADTINAKTEHDKKMADLQSQLDNENAFLTKHAADVSSVRNVMLLDELDKLKRSHTEQLASLDQQKRDAIKNAQDTSAGVSQEWSSANASMNSQFTGFGDSMGKAMGEGFKSAIKNSFNDTGKHIGNWVAKMLVFVQRGFNPKEKRSVGDLWKEVNNDPSFRALGGPVMPGSPYIVGEKGPELFMPSSTGSIIPHNETMSMMSGNGGDSYNINITTGAMMGSRSEAQEFAKIIWQELQAYSRRQGKSSNMPDIGIRPV